MDLAAYINKTYKEIKKRNPSFSMRAMAKKLEISPALLSGYLSGKKTISTSIFEKICQILDISIRDLAIIDLHEDNDKSKNQYYPINHIRHNRICEWQMFAILALISTKDFNSDPVWIARRLNISIELCKGSLAYLKNIGFITYHDNNIHLCLDKISTWPEMSSEDIRESHREHLLQGIESLEKNNLDERDITAMTMAIDSKKISKAKKMIKDFRRELTEYLESGEQDEVYNLNIQLVPLSIKGVSSD